jgi:hypothetical protein
LFLHSALSQQAIAAFLLLFSHVAFDKAVFVQNVHFSFSSLVCEIKLTLIFPMTLSI